MDAKSNRLSHSGKPHRLLARSAAYQHFALVIGNQDDKPIGFIRRLCEDETANKYHSGQQKKYSVSKQFHHAIPFQVINDLYSFSSDSSRSTA